MKRRGAVLLFAVVAAVGLSTVPAGATGRHHHDDVLVVDNEPRHRRSCFGTRDPFHTIQGAVNAAGRGDTIRVCPGTYKEHVEVDEPGLTIKGANAGRDATGHHRGRESVVEGTPGTGVRGVVQLLADNITWDGFTIRGVFAAMENSPGIYTSPGHSGYLIRDTIFQHNGSGIHLGSKGTHPTLICRNRFTANNEFEGPTGAFGIFSDERARQVLITSNLFEGHNGAAVFLADKGDPKRDVLIEHNKSVDDRTFASIFNSLRVRLTSNHIRARLIPPGSDVEPVSAIFIGARNDDIVVQKNKVKSASGNGIHITDTGAGSPGTTPPRNVIVRKNKVEHAVQFGIEVTASGMSQYKVLENRALTNGVGIHLGDATKKVLLNGNTALGNKTLDCQDLTNPFNNTWQENVGAKSVPEILCIAPTLDDQPVHDGKGHDKKKSKKHEKHHKKMKKHYRPDPCVCTLPWRF